jgi:hypothetical protein
MDAPQYQQPPIDPSIAAVSAKAQADDVTALQQTSQIDTASIMARYGTRLAMAGAMPQASPLSVAPVAPAGVR